MRKNKVRKVVGVIAILIVVTTIGVGYIKLKGEVGRGEEREEGRGFVRNSKFENALTKRDYGTLYNFLADELEFYLDGSGCCGVINKYIAIDNLRIQIGDEVKNDITFEDSELLRKVKSKFTFGKRVGERKDAIFGIQNNSLIIIYQTNKEREVNFIFISPLQIWIS
jgi:hypothetical protein